MVKGETMAEKLLPNIQEKMEGVILKWWYYLIFLALVVVTLPLNITSKNWSLADQIIIVKEILSNSLLREVGFAYLPIQLLTILIILLLIVLKNRIARLFCIYAGITFFFQAVLQNVAITEKYGLMIGTVNVILFPLVGLAWFLEAKTGKTDFGFRSKRLSAYWAVPLGLFAFWAPNSLAHFLKFDMKWLVTSGTTFGFCLMVPVYLAVMFILYPRVNRVTMNITAVVGLIIAFGNFMIFMANPADRYWHGIIHIPLLLTSITGIILSMRKQQKVGGGA
jgi:hypothetical protein